MNVEVQHPEVFAYDHTDDIRGCMCEALKLTHGDDDQFYWIVGDDEVSFDNADCWGRTDVLSGTKLLGLAYVRMNGMTGIRMQRRDKSIYDEPEAMILPASIIPGIEEGVSECGWSDIPLDSLFRLVPGPYVDQQQALIIYRKVGDVEAMALGNPQLIVAMEPSDKGYILVQAPTEEEIDKGMRGGQVTYHRVNKLNKQLIVRYVDPPDELGIHHDYEIIPTGEAITHTRPVFIHFQQGATKEHGYNGITNETLLAVLLHRVESMALDNPDRMSAAKALHEARMWLAKPALDRDAKHG